MKPKLMLILDYVNLLSNNWALDSFWIFLIKFVRSKQKHAYLRGVCPG